MAVPVGSGKTFSSGDSSWVPGPVTTENSVMVVLNWTAELERTTRDDPRNSSGPMIHGVP